MKRLKLETIVSDELYVRRKADKQLKQIIEDMSRPASILVARQMGKTNLLLNLKRECQSENELFVYIDLSKIDNDIRDCFRYIVDTAISTDYKKFAEIELKILEERTKNRLPYREHEYELELLLTAFNGKIVIILDEIDSMKKFAFSDQFFSQIRSVYYSSRTNNECFNNLTYVLSGVLEPSEIIKDKNKSPFNISEKVYLNDFTREEFDTFIKKIDFNFLTPEIIDSVYSWTNGHPRMIWNVCSMLQERYSENNCIENKDVDDVINILYLKHSDVPPIDHIRNLLNENKDMVQILLELKKEIFFNVDSNMRNKLYLYGLINISDTKSIQIKNKVFEEVLNEEYLKSILYQSKTPFEAAYDLFLNNEYSQALTEFSQVVELDDISREQKNISYYYISMCLYYLNEFSIALETFENVEFNVNTDAKMYYQTELQKGLCCLMLKKHDEALNSFNNVLNFEDKSLKINAFINKASIFIYDENKKTEEAISYLNDAIELLNDAKSDFDKEYFFETLGKAYFNKASCYYYTNEINNAIDVYNDMLNMEHVEHFKPNVLLELIQIDNQNKERYILKLNDMLNNMKCKITNTNDQITYSYSTLYRFIYQLILFENSELLNSFLNFCQNTYSIYTSKCNVLAKCVEHFLSDRVKCITICLKALEYEKFENNSKACYREIYQHLIYNNYMLGNYLELRQYIFKYSALLVDTYNEFELDYNHYTLINIILDELIKNNDRGLALKFYDLIEKEILESIDSEYIIFKAMLLDKKHELIISESDKKAISLECVNILSNKQNIPKDIHPKNLDYTKFLKSKHDKYLGENLKRTPITSSPSIGRNEPCPCGSGKKYKKCCLNK